MITKERTREDEIRAGWENSRSLVIIDPEDYNTTAELYILLSEGCEKLGYVHIVETSRTAMRDLISSGESFGPFTSHLNWPGMGIILRFKELSGAVKARLLLNE